jgi:hypothetical protein
MIEADPEADYFELPPPPPDDQQYQVKVLLGDGGVTVRRQERKGDLNGQRTGLLFLNFALELRIVDPGQPWDNAACFDNATSIVMQNSGTSKLHSILRALGAPAMGRMDLAALRDHALGVLAGEPTAVITGKWEARAKDQDGTYRTVLKGMKNFPLLDPEHPELGHSPWAEDRVRMDPKTRQQIGTGEMVRARFQVDNYLRR